MRGGDEVTPTEKKMTKSHIPTHSSRGLNVTAICGRGATVATGDHALIRRLAQQARREGNAAHYCAVCLRSL